LRVDGTGTKRKADDVPENDNEIDVDANDSSTTVLGEGKGQIGVSKTTREGD
jgi:hypothetical protein